MKKWPVYFYDKLILGDIDCNIGIVTLWTPVEKIADGLDKQTFSVAGQLYSKEGINFILRNTLANPKVTKLIICGEDRIGSGQALITFLEKGIDGENMVLDTDFCQIHKEISREAIEAFRENVTFENMIGEYDPKKIQAVINKFSAKGEAWREPELFPEKKIEFDGVMPTDQSVFKIRKKYAGDARLKS
jgi:tetrahydromethanopterin S-methyltransferase subunit A